MKSIRADGTASRFCRAKLSPKSLSTLIVLLAGFLVTGCGPFQAGALRGYDLNGDYQGFLEVEEQPAGFTLELLQSGGSLSGRLESDDGLVARGRGTLSGGDVHLEFTYGDDCPGVIVMTGEVLDGGERLLGEFRAEDCTGRTRGRFDLRR